jgi:RHS repeat-associated protein
LQDIHHQKPGGATLSRHTYTTSPVGQILTWQQQVDSNPATVYEYGYDRADQLTSAVQKTTGGSPTVLKTYGYAYDPAGNRTTESIDTAVVKATHDNRNRILQQQVGGSLRFAGSLNEPAAVTVAGQPAQVAGNNTFGGQATVTSGTQTVPVVATDPAGNVKSQNYQVNVTGSGATFTHDANGNLTGDGVRTFEWDAENRLTAVKHGASTVAGFAYDGHGRRRQKIAGGVTQTYVLESDHVAEERLTGGSTGTLRYFHASRVDDWLGRQETSSAATYFVTDHLGSVVRHTDSSGLPTLTRTYDAWGNLDTTSAAASGPAYTGREWDAETGQYYYRARYYDSHRGQFLSQDPAGFSAGPNLFNYVNNNPTNHTDPSGLMTIAECRALAQERYLACVNSVVAFLKVSTDVCTKLCENGPPNCFAVCIRPFYGIYLQLSLDCSLARDADLKQCELLPFPAPRPGRPGVPGPKWKCSV